MILYLIWANIYEFGNSLRALFGLCRLQPAANLKIAHFERLYFNR